MQFDIHPKLHPCIFKDIGSGFSFQSFSTSTSDETEEIDGVKHFVFRLDVSSASHPFYTGKQKLVDSSGRVEKFKARQAAAQKK